MPIDYDPTVQVGFERALGFTVTEVDGDHLTGRMVITPAQHQPYGIVHGGVYCSVAESAASIAAAHWFGDRGQVVGVSNSTSFLRAVREGELDVRCTPVHRGRTLQLWLVEITDAQSRLIARGEVRLANLSSADGLG